MVKIPDYSGQLNILIIQRSVILCHLQSISLLPFIDQLQMKFKKMLNKGTLVKRYKRFLADVTLESGEQITMHCPNTGAMTGCAEPGFTVWYSTSDSKTRKYPNTWELACNHRGEWIGINTGNANHIVKEALEANRIAELSGYRFINSEVKYGHENSRIDLLLSDTPRPKAVEIAEGGTDDQKPDCYIEVKSVTLEDNGLGYFPDAVTTRGQKHLRELMSIVEQGQRAVLVFLVQHTGILKVSPAYHIDKRYGELIHEALDSGVEILCFNTHISDAETTLAQKLEFITQKQGVS